VDELLAGATSREPMTDGAGKSGAVLERVVIDGDPYVVKYLVLADDWTLRAAGALGGATLALWERGILRRLPDCLPSPIVAVGRDPAPGEFRARTALLMRDVGRWLVPVSDEIVPLAQHRRFVAHMAALHAEFWYGAASDIDIVPAMHRYLELSPWTALTEAQLASPHLVPRLVGQGWTALEQVAPVAASVVVPLAWDPGPLVAALESTPQTFVHGNWKLDNLGSDAEGRTVLLDWESPGRGAGLSDLAWYLAINCRRLPESKEATIAAYREALEALGVDTDGWWDRQLDLSLLGALVQFGWEKALGGYDDELGWWEQRALQGARHLP
jgi:hypothetical protein